MFYLARKRDMCHEKVLADKVALICTARCVTELKNLERYDERASGA